MKHLSFLLITLFISSCCSAKQVVNNTQSDSTKTEIVELKVDVETTKPEAIEQQVPEPLEEVKVTKHYPPEVFNHYPWTQLLQKHVSNTGNVNYQGFKADQKALRNYINALGENQPTNDWNQADKLSYWINAYNAMTIDLIIKNYPIKSIKDIKDPWDQRLWKLGDKWYNLNEIEHDILRKMDEPRIHFGIVCASFSCPKLQNKAFTAVNLEEQLTQAAKEFLADKNRNEISQNSIKLSKIFQWFSKDFKQNGSLIDFLNQYSDIQISPKAKKSYKDYNWDLNE